MTVDTKDLVGEWDAYKWADAWLAVLGENPGIAKDRDTMMGWFANALMAGYDHGVEVQKKRSLHDTVREIAFMAAGVGSAAVMAEAPDVIMPSEEIIERVNTLLAEFGIEEE